MHSSRGGGSSHCLSAMQTFVFVQPLLESQPLLTRSRVFFSLARQMSSTPWARWPGIMWAPPRPMTSLPATRTPSGWWRNMAWELWWVAWTSLPCGLTAQPANKTGIVSFFANVAFRRIWKIWEKVQDWETFFVVASFFPTSGTSSEKSFNLFLYLDKSNTEHSEMLICL